MKKQEVIDYLNSTTVDDLPYLFIPSYKRPRPVSAKKILEDFNEEGLKKSYILVREEERDAYYEENKDLIERGCNLLAIPEGGVTGVGSTRNYILDYAKEHDLDVVADFDDDLTCVGALFEKLDKKGEPASGTFLKDERKAIENYQQKVLQAAGKCARECFERYPKTVVGSMRKQRFSNTPGNAITKFSINKGSTPRQTKIINMRAVNEKDLRVPAEFDKHGDDIGFVAHVLQEGYWCFQLPWLFYSYTPETESTTLRDIDEEKNRGIHQQELENLLNYDIRDYLRYTKKYDDGSYMYGDVNWRAYNKLNGSSWIVEKW